MATLPDTRKTLSEARAVNTLRTLKFRSSASFGDPLVALIGLYANVGEPGQVINRGMREFKDDHACIKTALEGLQGLEGKIRPPDAVDYSEWTHVGNYSQARDYLQEQITSVKNALQTDFPEEYNRAHAEIAAAAARR